METAAFIGVPMTEFWELTPFELRVLVRSFKKKRELQIQEANDMIICQSWLTARLVWAKKLPELNKLLKKQEAKKEMTDEQMLAQVKAINAMFGGEVVQNKK